MQATIKYRNLLFKQASGTSRGILRSKESWFLELSSDDVEGSGVGECSVIKGLSPDYDKDINASIHSLAEQINQGDTIPMGSELFNGLPALKFCYEMALKDYSNATSMLLYDSEFITGKGLPINGLVWMGTKASMKKQIKEKIASGYRCIKIKIAAIDFDEECGLLKFLREEYSEDDIQIRVDANGGFKVSEALENLKRLSAYRLHSIEQPIMPGHSAELAHLCQDSPLDIALDEELIRITTAVDRKKLLADIKPQYIILKPSLVGGFSDSEQWIALADNMNIDWWVTSALESNIGLNAIAQWTATLNAEGYQGLGTGQLYSNNIDSPLYIEKGNLFHGSEPWGAL